LFQAPDPRHRETKTSLPSGLQLTREFSRDSVYSLQFISTHSSLMETAVNLAQLDIKAYDAFIVR